MTPNILVHEYVSGGGWPDPDLSSGLMAEGLAMLRAILTDFKSWGGATVITTRDTRLADVPLPADSIINLDPSNHYAALEQLTGQCSAALIIAPESGCILERLSTLALRQGARLLGCSPESIATAANKWDCFLLFSKAGLETPDTWLVDVDKARETAEQIGFPLIIKPVDGVDCEGVCLIRDSPSFLLALEHNMLHKKNILIQRYIEGQHVSASLLISENNSICLSLNKQSIKIGTPFSYQGSEVPFTGHKHDEAVELARNAAALIPGLSGYVGVDMLISDDACYVIEINPRLTTSYIGLRQVVNINVAEAIWRASMEGLLPQEILLSGAAAFKKEDLT